MKKKKGSKQKAVRRYRTALKKGEDLFLSGSIEPKFPPKL
jgi:hypothetical protein